MSKFTETIHQDTPRLVVMYRQDGEKQLFQWGVVGEIPILILVGQIVRVQAELAFRHHDECDEMALVIGWDRVAQRFDCFVHPGIPVDSLVGFLETIKAVIVGTHMARLAAAQQVSGLFGPDGKPIRR